MTVDSPVPFDFAAAARRVREVDPAIGTNAEMLSDVITVVLAADEVANA